MHVTAINVGDLLIPLWRGQFQHAEDDRPSSWKWAVLRSQRVWNEHSRLVGSMTTYLPGSFDRPPRNPAKKIHSGYKAWEWLLYIYGMGPALFYGLLPQEHWENLCHLVLGVRLLQQHSITFTQVQTARDHLNKFADGFEKIYVQKRADRIHFVRPWIHAVTHMAADTTRKGPPLTSSQWTMERMVGDLGREIRSHSHPYANLSRRALLRCQVNALKALYPDLVPANAPLPRASVAFGEYVLLPRKDRYLYTPNSSESAAVVTALRAHGIEVQGQPRIQRRARLRLPNGQIARSYWKENAMTGSVRCSRNVSIQLPGHAAPVYAEVQYFFVGMLNQVEHAFAMVSIYGEPDDTLRIASFETIHACKYYGQAALQVIDIKYIKSVIAMLPHKFPGREHEGTLWFVVEKPGLDIAVFSGLEGGIGDLSLSDVS
ncbi:hypothetical protein CONPUDRAFT_65982 [Coniophora puteana RWD-64-598 SS2]|uniref:Uncharacterized protein n=1 Tax=Coniophora puteana (strain RWD-64-598) TaxID=741705 RepID=A0A5M3M9F3_CONPW|nr:uncharacterized protein CONPUDRAFT_65982 [Coniophora puteana RWD-64-598 SS2]EIW75291.1 hypothetical protein CONPUDRAFT_65982 [Coniophora puteana RWD-64-598 SS2]